MKYKCQCPCGCDYETNIKSNVNFHHIIAKSKGGKNNKGNMICLCQNCHFHHIYNGAKNHNIKNQDTFQLIRILQSTAGPCIQYKDFFGNIDYRFLNQ